VTKVAKLTRLSNGVSRNWQTAREPSTIISGTFGKTTVPSGMACNVISRQSNFFKYSKNAGSACGILVPIYSKSEKVNNFMKFKYLSKPDSEKWKFFTK
jgi:hypothetical protein